jgi:hypothetical protein
MQFLTDRGIDMTIKDHRWNSTAQGWARYAANDEKIAPVVGRSRTAAGAASSQQKYFWSSCRFSVSPTTIEQKNDELRFLNEQETSHREQTTETKEKRHAAVSGC